MPLISKLQDPKYREERGLELLSHIKADLRDRAQDWEARREVARNIYYGNEMELIDSWDVNSDLHFPVVTEKIDTMVPKLHNAFFNVEPMVVVRRVPEETSPEDTVVQEQFINWALRNDIPNFFTTTITWFRNMLLDGVAAVKIFWKREWRNTIERHSVKAFMNPGNQGPGGIEVRERRPKSVLELLRSIFQGAEILEIEPLGEDRYRCDIIEARRRVEDIIVEFQESEFVDEIVAYVKRRVMISDNPAVEVVEADKLILPWRSSDPQTADRVAQEHFMRLSQIEHLTQLPSDDPARWVIDSADMENLRKLKRRKVHTDDQDNSALKQQADDIEGNRGENQQSDPINTRYRFYEIYTKEDIDDDGQLEEVIHQVSDDLRKIVHTVHLETVYPHGRRPYASIQFRPSSERYYVPGMAEMLVPINVQVNTTFNQINENQELINQPWGFFEPTAMTVDPEILRNIEPGDLIPVNNAQGVTFPQWSQTPLSNLNVVDSMLMFADRLTGLSPFASGSTQMRNAPRTARGTLALISEGNVKIDLVVSTAQKQGWSEALSQLQALYAEFGPDEKHFWATGRDRKRFVELVTPKMNRGKFEYEFMGNTTNTNPEVQRTLAQIRYSVAIANPLYINDPVHMRELLRDLLQHFSEGTSVDNLLPDIPGQGIETHPPMSQRDELQVMRFGMPIDVHPQDNDAQHIAEIEKFMADSELTSTLPEFVVGFIFEHLRRHHQQMTQKMQQAQIAAANQSGGAEQSVERLNTGDLGAFEGGVV